MSQLHKTGLPAHLFKAKKSIPKDAFFLAKFD